MQQDVVTVGADLARNVHVYAMGAAGTVLISRPLRHAEDLKFFSSSRHCQVGMEACASARHWGREILAPGH